MPERIAYLRFYYVHGMISSDNRTFEDVEDALAYVAELVHRGDRATVFHLDREAREEK